MHKEFGYLREEEVWVVGLVVCYNYIKKKKNIVSLIKS